jgi:uncharacterized membrane protein YtjA (UPF0391 family)
MNATSNTTTRKTLNLSIGYMWNRGRRCAFFLFPEREIGRQVVDNLLRYAIAFLVVALVAGFLGFGGVAGVAMEGARVLFWIAIALFAVSLLPGIIRRS